MQALDRRGDVSQYSSEEYIAEWRTDIPYWTQEVMGETEHRGVYSGTKTISRAVTENGRERGPRAKGRAQNPVVGADKVEVHGETGLWAVQI